MRKGWGNQNKGRRKKADASRHASPPPVLSEYKAVWLFALFDLPVVTKQERKEYTRFRKLLLDAGFDMLQYSVYARYYGSEASSEADRGLIREHLPPDGQVRLVTVTDRQYGKMENYYGKKRKEPEEPLRQLTLF